MGETEMHVARFKKKMGNILSDSTWVRFQKAQSSHQLAGDRAEWKMHCLGESRGEVSAVCHLPFCSIVLWHYNYSEGQGY